ncbi:oocyte-expressed protein homolog [Peromyscus maniculatus bairdii]|uniref:oocyte-expressed protein homolog n=1 Tax=Peromyscus maniculatus bairdii TaxID=230844 RepID=UPI00042AD90D|nr:oocyte-expressed protein homolog [Peromyscus maniculatus bairdii]
MGPHTTDAHAETMRDPSSHKLLGAPPASPRLRVRPWWFPEHELENPLVLYMEAWLAEMIFGPNRSLISEIEWISQALLRVDTVDSGKMAEITIYGRPSVKNRMKNILSNLATWHKEHHVQRAAKMKQLEEFLKSRSSNNQLKPVKEAPADRQVVPPQPLEVKKKIDS